MSEELILQRLMEIFNQKILKKQDISEEELQFLDENIDRMKEAGRIDELRYSEFIVGVVMNPASRHFSSNEIANAISSMRSLEIAGIIRDMGDGHNFTDYQRMLYQLLNNPEVPLNDNDKARLINELEDTRYTYVCCMCGEGMSSSSKVCTLDFLKEQEYASREDYFKILYNISRNENSGINTRNLMSRIKDAKGYKAEEVTTEQDFDYNMFLRLCARDMVGLQQWDKAKILTYSQDAEFLKGIIEKEAPDIGLNKDSVIDLIVATKNQEYIEAVLRGQVEVDLGKQDGLSKLVFRNFMAQEVERALEGGVSQEEKRESYLRYLMDEGYNFTTRDKLEFVVALNDDLEIKNFLESHANLAPIEQSRLLRQIDDEAYCNNFMENEKGEGKIRLKDEYIRIYR